MYNTNNYKEIVDRDKKRIGELEVLRIFIDKELVLLKDEIEMLSGAIIKDEYKCSSKN